MSGLDIHQNSQKLILGLVHLILSPHFGKEVSLEASQVKYYRKTNALKF